MASLFDGNGQILTSSTIQPQYNMLIKTSISSWFDFSDLGEALEEGATSQLKTFTFEFEVVLIL